MILNNMIVNEVYDGVCFGNSKEWVKIRDIHIVNSVNGVGSGDSMVLYKINYK